MQTFFITGTDTGVGKTWVAVQLLKSLNTAGYSTFGMKPLASGCILNANGHWVNEDAIALQAAASINMPYAIVNPILLKQPIAPHLAARLEQTELSVNQLATLIEQSIQPQADFNIIEGAGGWCLPLNGTELFSDVIRALKLPVILVVAIRLGCLNHAILTGLSIVASRVPFFGWIANCIDPDALAVQENIDTLCHWLPAPCLGVVPNMLVSPDENTFLLSPDIFRIR